MAERDACGRALGQRDPEALRLPQEIARLEREAREAVSTGARGDATDPLTLSCHDRANRGQVRRP